MQLLERYREAFINLLRINIKMLPLDAAESTANSWSVLTSYDVVYVDACTWMTPEIGDFLQGVAPVLRESGRKLTIIAGVRKELENCAPLKLVAQFALDQIARYADVIETEEGDDVVGTADRQFVRLFFYNHRKRRQMLITHDQQLATDVENCCMPEEGDDSTAIMTIWPGGELISFAEMSRRKEAQARMRLAEMVGNSPVYIDSSALLNPNADRFLCNVAEPMQNQGKWVQVLRSSLSEEVLPQVEPILEANSEILHIIETDPHMKETDALLGELYLSENNAETDRLILVTDDTVRANELRNRRPKCDRFPFVDFMTINKYGFLSYLKLSDAPVSPTMSAPRQPRMRVNTATAPSSQEWAPAEKKPSSFVPQLIGAIKSEDIESMCAYIEKGANLRNGIITSLCQSKNNCLRVLIERAESIEVSCFNWWVVNFYNFSDPFYLGEDAEHYELLQALMDKCGPMTYCKEAMVQLARLVSRPAAAHEQLWNIISIAISKGAPSTVYSPETGETLIEIARRQNNSAIIAQLENR